MISVPGLTGSPGAMYIECGDHSGAISELFWVSQSRTCRLCCQQLSETVHWDPNSARRHERSPKRLGATGDDTREFRPFSVCAKLNIAVEFEKRHISSAAVQLFFTGSLPAELKLSKY